MCIVVVVVVAIAIVVNRCRRRRFIVGPINIISVTVTITTVISTLSAQ